MSPVHSRCLADFTVIFVYFNFIFHCTNNIWKPSYMYEGYLHKVLSKESFFSRHKKTCFRVRWDSNSSYQYPPICSAIYVKQFISFLSLIYREFLFYVRKRYGWCPVCIYLTDLIKDTLIETNTCLKWTKWCFRINRRYDNFMKTVYNFLLYISICKINLTI